jgi:hypothetical protein
LIATHPRVVSEISNLLKRTLRDRFPIAIDLLRQLSGSFSRLRHAFAHFTQPLQLPLQEYVGHYAC